MHYTNMHLISNWEDAGRVTRGFAKSLLLKRIVFLQRKCFISLPWLNTAILIIDICIYHTGDNIYTVTFNNVCAIS